MPELNELRGEVLLDLDGRALVLAPNFAVLAALEAAFGETLITLAERFVEGKAMLADMHKVITIAGGHDAKTLEAEKLVGKNYLKTQTALARFFAAALGVEV